LTLYRFLGSRISVWGCAALATLAALTGCGGSSSALSPAPTGWSFTTPGTFPVGDRFYVGMAGIPVHSAAPVHVRAAHLTGVPSGLSVLGVFAVSMRETDTAGLQGHLLGGAQEADIPKRFPHFVLHPAQDAVLVPDGKPLDWYLVAVVEASRPGFYKTTGVAIDYEADGQKGTANYAFIIELSATGPPATPLPPPLPLPV
jgi:hypothetical protein